MFVTAVTKLQRTNGQLDSCESFLILIAITNKNTWGAMSISVREIQDAMLHMSPQSLRELQQQILTQYNPHTQVKQDATKVLKALEEELKRHEEKILKIIRDAQPEFVKHVKFKDNTVQFDTTGHTREIDSKLNASTRDFTDVVYELARTYKQPKGSLTKTAVSGSGYKRCERRNPMLQCLRYLSTMDVIEREETDVDYAPPVPLAPLAPVNGTAGQRYNLNPPATDENGRPLPDDNMM
jgi:hypothetical protein